MLRSSMLILPTLIGLSTTNAFTPVDTDCIKWTCVGWSDSFSLSSRGLGLALLTVRPLDFRSR